MSAVAIAATARPFPREPRGRARRERRQLVASVPRRLSGLTIWVHPETGRPHRENDLPAHEFANGDREWLINGQRHRVGGPARRTSLGDTWYEHGEKHRFDGPAFIPRNGGASQFYLRGRHVVGGDFEAKSQALQEQEQRRASKAAKKAAKTASESGDQ